MDPTTFAIQFIRMLAGLIEWCILLQVVLSWFPRMIRTRFYGALLGIVVPIYRVIGKIVPPFGPIDLRPLVAFFALDVGVSLLISLLMR